MPHTPRIKKGSVVCILDNKYGQRLRQPIKLLASTNRQHFVTSVSGHTDADSIITIKDGTTVVWESKIDVSAEGFSFSFNIPCIPATPGAVAVGTIASSSADCQVNLTGYTI